ncbi:CHAT domain-containing tetratricopeptide repeat protein [Streptomyces sp. NBC_00443]|uniref:CHAT domain-containing tetratricopeptide repeat protein n=1 Tax=Streptomyces sp. NBC_00443 TaxID=2975743 RepID=UPI002E20B631
MTQVGSGQGPSTEKEPTRFSWKGFVGASVFSYLVSRAVMGGSWYPPVVFLVVFVVVVAVRHGRQGPMVGVREVRREAVHLKPLTDRLKRAMELGEAGDLAAAVELIDSVAAHPATERLPLVAANVAMLRSDIAVAQGDLPTAEREAVAAVRHHEQGTNRSTWSEALEKLGKIQLTMGRNEDAHRTLTQALEVGGGFMFRLSRVRVELYLTNLAFDADDIPRATEHATAARKLAAKWRCGPQQASACDMLAILALRENRTEDAARLTAEAARVLGHGDSALPHRVRHLIATALVAHAQGNEQEALAAYLAMMRGVAELRAGWGWRDAQTFYVDLYSEHEFAAYATAHTLHRSGDQRAVEAFALLLELGNRTALRRMLRGELVLRTPDDIEQEGMAEIVGLLTTLAGAEGTTPPEAARAAEVHTPTSPPGAGRQQVAQAYERLETLVSLRFRWALSASDEGRTEDPRAYAKRWNSHVLQVRLVGDGRTNCVAGLWTDPDGIQHPFLHPVEGAAGVLLGEVTGVEDLRPGPTPPTKAQIMPDSADGETEGVRAEAPDWRTTPRCRHLTVRDTTPWATLARLLLPPGLVGLLLNTSPAGAVPKLLVVPDSRLWRVPWTALSVEPDDPEGYVLDRAVLAMLPSLSLADSAAPGGDERATGVVGNRAFAYLAGVNAEGLDLERNALDAAYGTEVVHARTAAELLTVLGPDSPGFSVGAASVHGNDSPGLAHALRLDRRTQLSAARMLTLRFPRTLLINACLSAELDERRGTDPLGIPTVALCRGAETVIGGIFPLPDGRAKNPRDSHPTARILAILYRLLAEGVPPSTALRTAQRQYRAEVGPVPPRLWAGLVSITTTFEDPHRT